MSDKDGVFITNTYCIASEVEGKNTCHSSDAMSVYKLEKEDGSCEFNSFCWSCRQSFSFHNIANSTVASQFGIENGKVADPSKFKGKPKTPPLTKQQAVDFIKQVGYEGKNYRGLKNEYLQFYGHLTLLDKDGKPIAQFYPETQNNVAIPVGYKSRILPKTFGKLNQGQTGIKNDLSGQVKFKAGGKYVLIVGGELDKVAAYQMFREYQISKGQEAYDALAVVSPTTGESSAVKQIQAQYDWLDKFDYIYLGLDNDEAGQLAMENICKVLPADKIRIVTWSMKDPLAMLEAGKDKQFIRDFYNAKEFVASGIKSSSGMLDAIKKELVVPRLPLPPYMKKLAAMCGGKGDKAGPRQGTIINIIADTSTGKSSHVNSIVYHWIFNAPEKVGVVSLEATEGQYGIDMLSLHIGRNLGWMDEDEVLAFLDLPEIQEKSNNLFTDEYGEPRWHLIDERDGDIKKLERQMERLIKQYDCKIIVLDVLTDMLRGMDSEHQEAHMKWQKQIVKSGVTILNVLHTRKKPTSKDGKKQELSEYDAYGNSTFVQSAAINILLERDKEAVDLMERNTTTVRVPKLRGGKTGHAGRWYYDFTTRQIYDRDDYDAGNVTEKNSVTLKPTLVGKTVINSEIVDIEDNNDVDYDIDF